MLIFILKCFEERYPHYPSGFMAVVHNKKSHAHSLILSFCDHHEEKLPQIAVSVDMMDTGIDAPRVLNLVFFKMVRSYAKFWQMIGRGTRLCPDVFGPGQAKEHFLIFDVCGNFEFFDEYQEGTEGKLTQPISQQIFNTRLAVARLLLETGEEADRQLASDYLDRLHASIKNLDRQRFDVKMKQEYVDAFSQRARWNRLDQESIYQIEKQLSNLPIPESINEKARRFDLMMLKMLQANLLMNGRERKLHENVITIADELSKKYSIPQVARSKKLIEELRNPDFYKELERRKMEEIRQELRELVQYLETANRPIITTNFEDMVVEDTDVSYELSASMTHAMYQKQVERFIREHKHHIVISKLTTNQPITEAELEELQRILFDGGDRGTYEQYQEVYGDQPLGKFVRSITGLDIQAAQQVFADFIQSGHLSADQMKFIDNIIQYLNRNGTIDKALLFESPFTDMDDEGLFGLFDDHEAVRIIRLLDGVNENAEVG